MPSEDQPQNRLVITPVPATLEHVVLRTECDLKMLIYLFQHFHGFLKPQDNRGGDHWVLFLNPGKKQMNFGLI